MRKILARYFFTISNEIKVLLHLNLFELNIISNQINHLTTFLKIMRLLQ